jgi:hypothetical protein
MMAEPSEVVRVPPERAPIFTDLPVHEFVPSEFAPESGRCDTCGGGPLAEIHQKRLDPQERIAAALERIADSLEILADCTSSCDVGRVFNIDGGRLESE